MSRVIPMLCALFFAACSGPEGNSEVMTDTTARTKPGQTARGLEPTPNDVSAAAPVNLETAARVKFWRTIPSGQAIAVGTSVANACDLLSPVTLIDKEGDPKYGGMFLVAKGDSAILIDGSGVGVLFQTVRAVVLYSGSDSVEMSVGHPVIASQFLKWISDRVPARIPAFLRFTDGQSSKLNFSMAGYSAARSALKRCTQSQGSRLSTATQGNGFSLKSFVSSDLAKRNSIRLGEGWALRDGLYNNQLKIPREPEIMLEVSTKGDEVRHIGVTVMGTRRPDPDQILLMNEILHYAAIALNQAKSPEIRMQDFSQALEQIGQAKGGHVGRLVYRTASVGGDAVLSVDLSGY